MFISFQSWSAFARPLSRLILLIPRIPSLKYSVTLCYRMATFLCLYRPVAGIISPVNRSRSTTSLIAHSLFLSSSFFVLPLPVSGQSTNDYQSRSMRLNSVLMCNSARYPIESPRHRSITYSSLCIPFECRRPICCSQRGKKKRNQVGKKRNEVCTHAIKL